MLAKLVEEATEAHYSGPNELITELPDLIEVIDATISAHGLLRDDVEREQRRRREERGGFEMRLRLLWTE